MAWIKLKDQLPPERERILVNWNDHAYFAVYDEQTIKFENTQIVGIPTQEIYWQRIEKLPAQTK